MPNLQRGSTQLKDVLRVSSSYRLITRMREKNVDFLQLALKVRLFGTTKDGKRHQATVIGVSVKGLPSDTKFLFDSALQFCYKQGQLSVMFHEVLDKVFVHYFPFGDDLE